MRHRISRDWFLAILDDLTYELPTEISIVLVAEDIEELLNVSLGYLNRRVLTDLMLYRKLHGMAGAKFSPTIAKELANDTTYDVLITLERRLELTYKLRLHYTTHFVEVQEEYVYITEFPITVKPYTFKDCPVCHRIQRSLNEETDSLPYDPFTD